MSAIKKSTTPPSPRQRAVLAAWDAFLKARMAYLVAAMQAGDRYEEILAAITTDAEHAQRLMVEANRRRP